MSYLLYCVAAGEQVSEEEESGADEEFDSNASVPDDTKLDRRKSGTKKKNRPKTLLAR